MVRAAAPLHGRRLVETLIGGWRPLARMDADGFALLRSRGVTRRANSAVLIDPPADDAALASAVDRMEQLVALTGGAPVFRVFSPEAMGSTGPTVPKGPKATTGKADGAVGAVGTADGLEDHEQAWSPLEALLIERGYTAEGTSRIMEIALDTGRLPAPDGRARTEVGPPSANWEEAAWRLAPRSEPGARETLHDIMAGTPAVHVAIEDEEHRLEDGRALAVGRAAIVPVGRGAAAVLNRVAVAPEVRRRGLGTSVSRSLLAAAAVQGAERALLEVEDDSTAAIALYRGLGMVRTGEHRYRVRA